ncbi:MAG TPA: methionyl-tRNA formyltransferase [Acidimicrobiales bacterium]|nr:methionyl-tRNA formyltransferase [Acidimicrobiales bacterium]
MKLAYLGTPEAAVPPLRALVEAGHEIPIVVSQADKKRGRGGALVPSPVKAAALELGIPVTSRVADVVDAGVELGVVVAFGRLIKRDVLARVPMINVHFSLLPRWRGAAPVERAILAGDTETGVGIMQLEEELDTGGLYAEERVTIGPDETADELRARLVDIGTSLLVDTLARPLTEPVPQVGQPTYAAKIEPDELRIDWSRPAEEIHRLVRLGRAWTTFRGDRLRVLRGTPTVSNLEPGVLDGALVGTGRGALELVEVQPAGKGPQPAAAWRNGARLQPGDHLE